MAPPKRANPISKSSAEAAEPWYAQLVDEVADRVIERIGAQRAHSSHRRLLTVAEAAERLGRTTNAVYLMIQRGKIPATRMDGRLMIDMQRLDRIIEASTDD